jgi:glycosyltransferase involved in cell wall biosynthesis
MNILFITPHGNLIYGGEKSLLILLRELRSRGVKVSVVCREDGIFIDALKAEGVETILCQLQNMSRWTVFPYIASVFRLWNIVRKVQPDIIHCNSSTGAQLAVPVAKLLGISTVAHIRNELTCQSVKRYMVNKACAVIANSIFTARAFEQCKGSANCHIIYNPIELHPHELVNGPADNKVVLFVGMICPIKGIEMLINIAEQLNKKGCEVKFIAAGDEPYHAKGFMREMKDLAKDKGVASVIEFAGRVENIDKYYTKATMVVVPSKKETFGRVAAEAMMYGLPVVASRVGGLPEVVEDNVTGFLVDPEDIAGFTQKVEYFLNNPEKANTMGRAGRERAIKLFSPQRHADQVMEVYKEVLK